ncbi:hypothetical protein ACLK19_03590 [Escherichia coli]
MIKAPGRRVYALKSNWHFNRLARWCTVMPYATVYRYNRIALDTNTMGNSIDVEKILVALCRRKRVGSCQF